jgi:hypothetical protein
MLLLHGAEKSNVEQGEVREGRAEEELRKE